MSKSTQRTFFGGYCDTFLYVHDRATHARKLTPFMFNKESVFEVLIYHS